MSLCLSRLRLAGLPHPCRDTRYASWRAFEDQKDADSVLRSAFDVLRTNLQPLLTEDEMAERIGHVPLFLTPANWGTWFEAGVTPANCPRKVRCALQEWRVAAGFPWRQPKGTPQPQAATGASRYARRQLFGHHRALATAGT